jgi:hypothetical protein
MGWVAVYRYWKVTLSNQICSDCHSYTIIKRCNTTISLCHAQRATMKRTWQDTQINSNLKEQRAQHFRHTIFYIKLPPLTRISQDEAFLIRLQFNLIEIMVFDCPQQQHFCYFSFYIFLKSFVNIPAISDQNVKRLGPFSYDTQAADYLTIENDDWKSRAIVLYRVYSDSELCLSHTL